jgi:site-specific recombinase XerD
MQVIAPMSKALKRTRSLASKVSSSSITIREEMKSNGSREYLTHCVQGWRENGKWMRKRFTHRKDAERFAAAKRIEIENKGAAQRLILTPLTDEQAKQATDAFDKLGGTYTLADAIDYFLKNHRPPSFVLSLSAAVASYIDDCTSSGTRARTIGQKESVLFQFVRFMSDAQMHTITSAKAMAFLKSLRAKDGVTKATRKTWNNYRNDLHHFFKWAAQADLTTNRPYIFSNPFEETNIFTAKQVAEQRKAVAITSPSKLARRLSALMRWRDGNMVKAFALAYFAGIRPDGELTKLAAREKELINLKTRTIHIPAAVSKTKEERQIQICDSLAAWLTAYKDRPILPKNHSRLTKRIRAAFHLQHDETRHSFISYHVALHRSVGDAALQAGNSESIVKKHYLNLRPAEEGAAFFAIVPDLQTHRTVTAKNSIHLPTKFKVI